MQKAIRILLVDDHQVVRDGLRHMLESELDMEVVGEAANAREAFPQMELLPPDVILMDIQMPGTDGLELTRQLRAEHPSCSVIMLTLYEEYREQAIEAGAARYLLKDVKRTELAQTIREVHRSKSWIEIRSGKLNRCPVQMIDGSGTMLEEVQLVVKPPVDLASLMKFTNQVEEMLHDNYAGIVHIVGSWDRGTVIKIRLRPTTLATLRHKLANMPDVITVEEEPEAEVCFSGLLKNLGGLRRSSTNPSKRICVTLKGTGMAREELAASPN